MNKRLFRVQNKWKHLIDIDVKRKIEFHLTIGIRYFLKLNLSNPFNDDIAQEKKISKGYIDVK